jgi:hypothetical protein
LEEFENDELASQAALTEAGEYETPPAAFTLMGNMQGHV